MKIVQSEDSFCTILVCFWKNGQNEKEKHGKADKK